LFIFKRRTIIKVNLYLYFVPRLPVKFGLRGTAATEAALTKDKGEVGVVDPLKPSYPILTLLMPLAALK
jgi:hypothetical protein